MPFDWNTFGAIAGQNTLNVGMQHLTNVKNRKFSREMYNRQRQDSLADWAMQNEYNSPRAQMQRFQEAGLNPNLIYGQANYGADIRSSNSSSGNAQAPSQRLVGEYMDVRQRSAQMDLLAQNMELIKSNIRKNDAQSTAVLASVPGIEQNIKRGAVKLALEQSLVGYQQEGARLGVEGLKVGIKKTEADTDRILAEIPIMQARNEREAAMNKQSIDESLARIRKIGSEIGRIGVENRLTEEQISKVKTEVSKISKETVGQHFSNGIKKLELQMMKDGIIPGTPGWIRSIENFVERFRDKIK